MQAMQAGHLWSSKRNTRMVIAMGLGLAYCHRGMVADNIRAHLLKVTIIY